MDCVILAGGKGKRLNLNYNKVLLKINNKTLLHYNINLAQKYSNNIFIVTGFDSDNVKNHILNINPKIKIIKQNYLNGAVDALSYVKKYITSSHFLLILGDDFITNLSLSNKINYFGLCNIVKEYNFNEIKKTYSINFNNNNKINYLIEKPNVKINNWKGTGYCILSKNIFEYINICKINKKTNQKTLPDLFNVAINNNKKFIVNLSYEKYFNINTKNDLNNLKKYMFIN